MALVAKLLKAQRQFPKMGKNATNPHFKNDYISLDDLIDAVVPILNDNGLLLLQAPTMTEDGTPTLTTFVFDADDEVEGDSLQFEMPLMLDKANSQGLGSAITYARRYSLVSILALAADEDDDGEAASPRPAHKNKTEKATGGSPLGSGGSAVI